jgi:probable addiction module antidote protein
MKKKNKLKKLDIAEYLKTESDINGFIKLAVEEGDPQLIAHALGIAARAKNMTAVAKKIGMTRAGLYRALSGSSKPSFDTVLKVIHALGLKLRIS